MNDPTGPRRVAPTVPRGVVLAAVAGIVVVFALPLIGLVQRAPWSDFTTIISDDSVLEAIRLSLVCSLAATAAAAIIGFPIAWMLARASFPGRRLLTALVMLPLVLPPVVGGVALFFAFGRRGIIGQWLDRWFDIQLPFTTWAAIIAETFVAMPMFIVTVEGALRNADRAQEDAAATLGSGPWTTMRRVTVPSIAPSIGAALALTWARALGEFGATITFAGNFPGRTQTLPLSIYLAFENGNSAGLVLSVLLLVVSAVVLTVVGSRVMATRRTGGVAV